MSNNKLDDLFFFPESLETNWDVDESEGNIVVDGVNILGRVRGQFFAVEGSSRNGRYYTKKLWENAITKTADKVKSGLMIGSIGHDQPIDDEALREGRISHRVTKLWIDESGSKSKGMGEIVIFNTPVGQRLNSYMRGGLPIAVSSRADGKYNGIHSGTGHQMVDENAFELDTFDFVLKPGVPTAIPSMVESSASLPDNVEIINEPTKDDVMSPELLETLTTDKVKLQGQLSEALSSVESEKRNSAALQQALDATKKDVARLEESLGELKSKNESSEADKASLANELRAYKDLGEAAEIRTSLVESKDRLAQYEEFGTVSELTEAFEQAKTLIDDYSELGSPDEIEGVFEDHDNFLELGTLEEIEEKLALLKQYEDLGTPAEINTLVETAAKYAELGSPDTIAEAFETMDALVTKFDEDNKSKEADAISKQFSVKKEIVEGMITKHGKTETVSILESLKTDQVSERYRAPSTPESENRDLTLNENAPSEGRGARLMKHVAR